MQIRDPGYVSPQLELSLADYSANGASISCSEDGIKFAFTLWPLSDETFAALEGVAQKRGRISLSCCRVPMPFDLVEVECKEPHKARIVGRIVGDVPYLKDDTA